MTTMESPTEEPWRVDTATSDMRKRIRAGDFRQEDGSPRQLPPARELGEQYGLSRVSANKVIGNLRADGLVQTRSGNRGALVREWDPIVFLPQQEFEAVARKGDLLVALVEAVARKGESRIDEVIAEPAAERIGSRLRLRPGEHVGVRRRTSVVDGVPTLIDDSFVPLRLIDGTDWLYDGNVVRGTNKVLSELGHELIRGVDELRPRYTTAAENARLDLGPGSVNSIEILSTGFDRSDMPVQVTVLTLPGSRNTVVYERHRSPKDSE